MDVVPQQVQQHGVDLLDPMDRPARYDERVLAQIDERTADVDSVMQSIIDAREEAIIRQLGREAARED